MCRWRERRGPRRPNGHPADGRSGARPPRHCHPHPVCWSVGTPATVVAEPTWATLSLPARPCVLLSPQSSNSWTFSRLHEPAKKGSDSLLLVQCRRQAVSDFIPPCCRRRSGFLTGCTALTFAGAVIEMIHLATLYHGGSGRGQVRRGAPSANAWGNNVAILAGDYLQPPHRGWWRVGTSGARIIAICLDWYSGQMRERAARRRTWTPSRAIPEGGQEKTGSLIGRPAGWVGCSPRTWS